MRRVRLFGAEGLAALLVAVFLLQGLFLIKAMSATADEVPFHIVNGYAYLKTHDYRMSPANPALIRQWVALPLLWIRPKLDLSKKSWAEADSVSFAYDFFYRDNRAINELLLNSARFMNLLLGLTLGLIIFLWSRRLYGDWGGLLSLAFYVFCPNFLAHSSIAHTDIGVSLFSVMAAFFLWRTLEYSKWADLWALSLSLGLACAAKYNALVFVPLFLLILLFKKGALFFLKSAGLFAVVSFFVIWASYGFEFKPILGGPVPRVQEKLRDVVGISQRFFPGNASAERASQKAALELPIPMPTYLLGLAAITKAHGQPYRHFAFGEWTTDTRWYYYLFSFFIKMSLPFLCLLFLRAVFFKKAASASRHESAVILLPALAVFFMTCFDTAQVGVRYLFPVIPLFFVWIGGLTKLGQTSLIWRWVLGSFFALNLLTTLPFFPNYLSYFNPVAAWMGGGYRYVRGSDVDWGQGLKALKSYMDDHKISEVTLQYFGPADTSFYDIKHLPLSEEESKVPAKTIYAISIFYLEHAEWSGRFKPIAVVGGSIFIYDFR